MTGRERLKKATTGMEEHKDNSNVKSQKKRIGKWKDKTEREM